MRFEAILLEVGGFCRFQFLVLGILTIPRVVLPLHFLLHNFISAVPPHRCLLPHLGEGYESHERDGSVSSCRQFLSPSDPGLYNGSVSNVTVSCQQGWLYDRTVFRSTTATQWNLVCDKKNLNQVLATYFFVGVTVGAVLFGYLSDRFGRKPMLLLSFVASFVFGLMASFSTSYVMFVVSRTLSGVFLVGMSITTVALSVEWTDVEHRTFMGTVLSVGWSLGNMLLSLLAFLLRDWRHLMQAVTVPCLLAIATWWWVPESARWLLVNRRVEEARSLLLQCAKFNGKTAKLDTETLHKVIMNEVSEKDQSYLDLAKTPKMRKIAVCSGVVWFAVAFTYYGISFDISDFGLDVYLTQFIYAAVEVPAKVGTYFVLRRIGRRPGQAWSLILCGALIGMNTVIPAEFAGLRTCVAVLGKGFSEMAFTTAFLYTAELYPTVVRQCGLGYTSFLGRLGGSLAPLLVMLEPFWHFAPPVIFAFTALVSGCVGFFLPETLDACLPETIQDVEEGRHRVTEMEMNEINSQPLVTRGEEENFKPSEGHGVG